MPESDASKILFTYSQLIFMVSYSPDTAYTLLPLSILDLRISVFVEFMAKNALLISIYFTESAKLNESMCSDFYSIA